MKKIVSTLVIVALIIGTSTLSYGAGYTDIKTSNWAYDAVNTMSAQTIIKGYPDGSFKPSSTVTYGEFIKMALIAATGEDLGNAESGNWATGYYEKALEYGYFTEDDINKDLLNEKITRAHMALIISSILGDVTIEDYDTIEKTVTDITAKTPYEYEIIKSYAIGILTGYTDKTFRPTKTLSRAEAATVIYRLVDESKRITPTIGGVEAPEIILDEMITNYESFKLNDGSIDDTLAKVEKYTIMDGSSVGLKSIENNGITSIYFPSTVEHGAVYLVKDNKVIESTMAHSNKDKSITAIYESDITIVDYIAVVNGDYVMTLFTNPFKK